MKDFLTDTVVGQIPGPLLSLDASIRKLETPIQNFPFLEVCFGPMIRIKCPLRLLGKFVFLI